MAALLSQVGKCSVSQDNLILMNLYIYLTMAENRWITLDYSHHSSNKIYSPKTASTLAHLLKHNTKEISKLQITKLQGFSVHQELSVSLWGQDNPSQISTAFSCLHMPCLEMQQ